MPIHNRNNYPYLYPDRIEMRDNTFAFQLRNWNDANYFYAEFLFGPAFRTHSLNSWLPQFFEKSIRENDKWFLVLNNCHEAFHSVIDDIYQHLIIKENFPAEKIILISESADVHNVVKEYAEKNNLRPINVEWTMMFKAGTKFQRKFQLEDPNYQNFETLTLKDYPKTFLNFNRRWRLHRPAFVALLVATGILDRGYVSLGKSDCGTQWSHVFEWIKQRFSSDKDLYELLNQHKNTIVNLPPLYLDNTDLMTNKADLETSTDSYYADTLLSVVSETNFFPEFETGRFLSEKTWKPVAYKHPFIMVSVPRTMKLLRHLGYKTFHPYIDETYDAEENPVRRLRLIVEELKRISNFTQTQREDFIHALKPKVEHNFNLLMNTETFTKKML